MSTYVVLSFYVTVRVHCFEQRASLDSKRLARPDIRNAWFECELTHIQARTQLSRSNADSVVMLKLRINSTQADISLAGGDLLYFAPVSPDAR
jgi:hypothetical protein